MVSVSGTVKTLRRRIPNGLLLRYRSRRLGFVPYVIGQIREVAKLYYDTTITVVSICRFAFATNSIHVYMDIFVVCYDTTITVQVLNADGEPSDMVEEIGDDGSGNGSPQDSELLTESCHRRHCSSK